MGLKTKISTRPENVHVHSEGEFSLADAKRDFVEVVETVERTGLVKILYDGRDVTGTPEVLERFFYGSFAAGAVRDMLERGFKGGTPQFAYVLEEPMLDPDRLGETAARNRGMDIKAFDNIDGAVEWLGLRDEEPVEIEEDPQPVTETENAEATERPI